MTERGPLSPERSESKTDRTSKFLRRLFFQTTDCPFSASTQNNFVLSDSLSPKKDLFLVFDS